MAKHGRIRDRLTALLLCAALLAGMAPAALAVRSPEEALPKTGFRSDSFLQRNSYRYEEQETVRAIVLLKGEPAADRTADAGAGVQLYEKRLKAQHASVYRAMSARQVEYELAYEFDTLLNGFSCDVAYGDLEKIAALPQVEAVHIANRYRLPEDMGPYMDSSNTLTGNGVSHTQGYTGQGTVIAVLDSGMNLDHQVFQVYGAMMDDGALTLSDLEKTGTAGRFVSKKVPFAYDYADKDRDVSDNNVNSNGHGTHVSGIAVGYAEDASGGTVFTGAAPAAQLLAMKVFSDWDDGTSSDVYFSALEDAYLLGADVVNLSFGAPGGFTYDQDLENEVFGNIYDRLHRAGIAVCVAAGNEACMAVYSSKNTIGPDYTDYGTVATPSTYSGNISVAASGNNANLTMPLFSSWGPSPDLTLRPSITSVGRGITSADHTGNSKYVRKSGTSMASPNFAGTFACVLSYLYQNGVSDKDEAMHTAEALLESTARYLTDEEDDCYSVRRQGAGLAVSDAAIAAHRTGAYITEPLREPGDSASGVFRFDVTLQNDTASAVTYTPAALVMTDSYTTDAHGELYNLLCSSFLYDTIHSYPTGLAPTAAAVTYTVNGSAVSAVTAPAGGSVTVGVTVTVNNPSALFADLPYGAYVEGFVQFSAPGKETVHATYLGYYGDWTAAPVLEPYDFRDYAELADRLALADPPTGEDPYDYLKPVTDLNFGAMLDSRLDDRRIVLPGDNPIDYAPYDEKHIAISNRTTNADCYYADTLYLVPYQLRNAEHLIMTVSRKDDPSVVYYTDDTPYLPKAMYDATRREWMSDGMFLWRGKDADGVPLPNGTVVHVQFDAVLPYGHTRQENCWSFDMRVDTVAPVISACVFDKDAGTLTVTASDDQYLAGIYLTHTDGRTILKKEVYSDGTTGVSHTAVFDVSEYIREGSVHVCAMDYATNETDRTEYFFETGQPAVITLITPERTQTVSCRTGDLYTFEACTDPVDEGAQFLLWNSLPVPGEVKGAELLSYLHAPYTFTAGERWTVAGDVTLYAVYEVGELTDLEKPLYTYQRPEDYSGDWALVGLPYDMAGSFVNDEPYVLDELLRTKSLLELDPRADLTYAAYNEFNSAVQGFRYTFARLPDGTYTIKNARTGKYLSMEHGQLSLSATAQTASDHWLISSQTEGTGKGSLVRNAYHSEMCLLFDDEPGTMGFRLMNTDVPVSLGQSGTVYHADDIYVLWLYRYRTQDIIAEYYTSDPPRTEEEDAPGGGGGGGGGIAVDFLDVPETAWFYEDVYTAVALGLMVGTDAEHFSPLLPLDRSMVATVLHRAEGSPAGAASAGFPDVPAGRWFSAGIDWAAEKNIVAGYDTGNYGPTDPVTREQLASILYRYAQYKRWDLSGTDADLSEFTDEARVSPWAREGVAWAYSHGIMRGKGGTLDPLGGASRAEATSMLVRLVTQFSSSGEENSQENTDKEGAVS